MFKKRWILQTQSSSPRISNLAEFDERPIPLGLISLVNFLSSLTHVFRRDFSRSHRDRPDLRRRLDSFVVSEFCSVTDNSLCHCINSTSGSQRIVGFPRSVSCRCCHLSVKVRNVLVLKHVWAILRQNTLNCQLSFSKVHISHYFVLFYNDIEDATGHKCYCSLIHYVTFEIAFYLT